VGSASKPEPAARGGGSRIPFNRPFIVGRELFYIARTVVDGRLANKGGFTHECCRWMEHAFGASKVILTHSCTAALEISALLCNVEPGDEVIMPSFTYVTTATAFCLRGARIRFVDIRPDTLNIDEDRIAAAIGGRTKAIVPIHYAGVGAEMDPIMRLAGERGLVVVEDAAQAVNATYKERYLGTIGHLGAYSFHETKNFISGQGGALVVNDARFAERADVIAEKGTNRVKFFQGEVDKYTWTDLGSSYLASELTAAFLYAQLEAADLITSRRRAIFERYARALAPLEERGLVRLPGGPEHSRHNAHMFYLVLPDERTCQDLRAHLARHGIQAVRHYVPLHTSPMGRRMGYRPGDLPVTEDLSERLLRLPCYFGLEPADQDRVIEAVEGFLGGRATA
jgi:dTDP-4-amino-4,6-dideoxygalactose transaminase